jgi:hypothetical protein
MTIPIRTPFGMAANAFSGCSDGLARILVLVHAVLACFLAASSGEHWVAMLYDDFFYYLKIAENLANGQGSTFNGVVQTNGYHPLWLLILTGANAILGRGVNIFYFVCLVCVCSTLATYHFAREVLGRTEVPQAWATVVGLYVAAFSIKQFFSGMEAILVIPFALALMARMQQHDAAADFQKAFGTGLLASCMVLSRLDSLILLALMLALFMAQHKALSQLTGGIVVGWCLGLAPIGLYVLSNLIFFDSLTPVSGMAKQLMPKEHLTASVLQGVLNSPLKFQANFLFATAMVPFAALACWRSYSLSKGILLAALLFPPVYFLLLSYLSDWCFSDWYFYPVRLAVCAAAAFVFSQRWLAGMLAKPMLQVTALVMAVAIVLSNWWVVNRGQKYVYEAGADLAEFERSHPGTYAMGDRAGKVGYLMHSPLIQLEGLVMDKQFVQMMAQGRPLHDVLAHYQVDYYIGSSNAPFEGCFQAVESCQAGAAAPTLKGKFCAEPVARFKHGDVETLVYKAIKD